VSQPWTVRPLTRPETIPLGGAVSPFRGPWGSTLALATYELNCLGARQAVLEVQLAAGESDLRLDGGIRANARMLTPRVRVSFESRYGPLSYATGRFSDWQSNVRAVVLSLEALRKVDRYGVSRRGEQYTGWRAIEAGPAGAMTVEQAAKLLAGEAGLNQVPEELVEQPSYVKAAYRATARRLHPDVGGTDPALWQQIREAKAVLDRHHGGTT
jgi:hypothetical protein